MVSLKVAVVSTALPPAPSGQAIVLGRLLRERDARCWFFSDNPDTFVHNSQESLGEYRLLRPLLFGLSMRDLRGPLGELNAHLGMMRPIRIRAAQILEQLATERPDVVIGCSGSPFDLPASALVAKQLGTRFIAYLFDDPVYQWPRGLVRKIVRRLESRWASQAECVICPNTALADVIEQRTGRAPIVISNPRDDAIEAAAADDADFANIPGRPVRILYSGAVSESQRDALANLANVVGRANGKFELHIFTQQPHERLAEYGLLNPYVFRRGHVSAHQIALQRDNADILFLPLSFNSPIQEVLMTASPGKMGEYLASKRPLLVHAPKGSFVARFMTTHRAGHVVDVSSPVALATALDELVGSADLRADLVRSALKASELFSERGARDRFWEVLATRKS